MDAVYRQVAAKKRHFKSTDAKGAEKRRLIQLGVSLVLFCIVFLGRSAFPELNKSLKSAIVSDTSLAEIEKHITDDHGMFSSLKQLAVLVFGSPEPEIPVENNDTPDQTEQKPVEITPLLNTQMHGLSIYRENGLREYKTNHIVDSSNEIQVSKPQIVTAVAQAYNENGEALPRNVSYQYYELGLDHTVVPVMGEVTSGFEYRTSPISGRREFHLALDIAAPKGTSIAAFADGVVRYIGESDDFGLYLMIDHANGVATFYAHCSELLVHKGDKVICGDTVALVGNTGNATGYHLHFTIEKDNIRLDPAYYVDPEK